MRADRLLSLLMLLQARGRMTARELAVELEVSERTIYRDLTALSTSGVPVYCERGPGGGVALVEEYRTTLTGLNPDEARALFMVSLPAPLLQLGVGQEFQAAMRKLSAALPESKRREQVYARQRIHLDSSWWFQSGDAVPCLPAVQQGVWNDRLLWMKFRANFGAEVEQVVAPYGLVAKANLWHLVYSWQGSIRVLRLSQVMAAQVLPESFTRPDDFDLASYWQAWCEEYEHERTLYLVRLRVSPALLPQLVMDFGGSVEGSARAASPDSRGWMTLDLPFESLPVARRAILSYGGAAEVLGPEALRCSVRDFAEQVLQVYQGSDSEMLLSPS